MNRKYYYLYDSQRRKQKATRGEWPENLNNPGLNGYLADWLERFTTPSLPPKAVFKVVS
jgi:hypothetical protein